MDPQSAQVIEEFEKRARAAAARRGATTCATVKVNTRTPLPKWVPPVLALGLVFLWVIVPVALYQLATARSLPVEVERFAAAIPDEALPAEVRFRMELHPGGAIAGRGHVLRDVAGDEIKVGRWEYFDVDGEQEGLAWFNVRGDGTAYRWSPSLELMSRKQFHAGRLEVETVFHSNGNRSFEVGMNRAGRMHGPYRSWSYEGKLRVEGHYDDGRKDGRWVFYQPDGQRVIEHTYDRGLPVHKERYKIEGGEKVADGRWTRWNAQGEVAAVDWFENGARSQDDRVSSIR